MRWWTTTAIPTRPICTWQAFELKSDGRAARRAAWDSGRKLKEQAKKEATAIQEKENQVWHGCSRNRLCTTS